VTILSDSSVIFSMYYAGIKNALEDVFGQFASANGSVIITTYDTFRGFRSVLLGIEWTAVGLDEGNYIVVLPSRKTSRYVNFLFNIKGQKIRNPITGVCILIHL